MPVRYWTIAAGLLLATMPGTAVTPEQRVREERLANSLLAPCCYAEPVSRHSSEIAIRMRMEIARFVEDGRSDPEIVQIYKQRYGAKVFSPPKETGRWVYLVPFVVLLFGLVLVLRWLRRHLAPHAAA